MKRRLHQRFTRYGLFLVFMLFNISFIYGQILTFDFAGISGNEATAPSNYNDVNLQSSIIQRGPNNTPAGNQDRFNANNWPTSNALDTNNYFEIILTPNSGYRFEVTSIQIQVQRSGTGPRSVSLRSSLDGYSSDISQRTIVDNTSTQAFTMTMTPQMSNSSVSFRFYFYNAESGAGTGGIGDYNGNDIVISGNVLPISGNPPPNITNVVQSPIAGEVTSSDPVTVTADVTDDSAVDTVELSYGTVSGNLNEHLTMTLVSGDTYTATIPDHPDGTTIYYEITAMDDQGELTTTREFSYTVNDPVVTNNIAIQDFDNSLPQWQYTTSIPTFGDPQIFDDFYGIISLANAAPLNYPNFQNNIFGENDLNSDNGTAGFASMVFEEVNIESYLDVNLSFDFQIKGYNASTDDAKYELFYDGLSQGEVFLHDGGSGGNDSEGTLSINIPNSVSTLHLIISIRNDGSNGYSGFDNFAINGTPNFDYVYSNGTWSPQDPSGNATAADDLLVADGTAVLSADTDIHSLTINPGATLAVERVLNITGNITNNGELVFISSATANGELGPVPAGSTITGQATVQRYMSANRVYRLVSSAVTTTSSIRDNWQEGVNNPDTGTNLNPNPGFGTHITGSQTGANGFDATGSGNPSLFRLDATQQAFVAVANTDVNTLTAGDPYLLFVRGDRSIDLNSNASPPTETILRARGVLAVGEVVQDNLSTVAGEFGAIGNPYQSAVNIKDVFGASTNINPNHYYVFDPTQGTNGIYVTVSLPSGNNSTNGSSAANQYLQPGQGAQVQTLNNGATSAVFREAHKAPGQFAQTSVGGATIFTQQASITGQLYITDNYNGNGRIQDSFGVLFGPGFDNAITPMDAPKAFNFKENIALDNNGSLLGLEYRALPEDMEQLALYTANYSETDYTFTLQLNMGSTRVMLQDRFTGSLTQLEEGDNVYAFSVDPAIPESVASDRFSFVFSVPLIGVGEETVQSMAIYPNPAKDHIYLSFATGLEVPVTASIHDLQGRRMFGPKTLEGNTTYRLELPQLNTGTYFLRVDSGQQTENKRIIIE